MTPTIPSQWHLPREMTSANEPASWQKPAMWNAGWLVLAMLWVGPFPWLASQSFALHMLLHMMIVCVVSPLLAIALAGGRLDLAIRIPVSLSPLVACVFEWIVVWSWHMPRLHHWSQNHTSGFVAEQLSFLIAGIWLWLSAFGGLPEESRWRRATGVIGFALTSMHMFLLGALFSLSPRVLFDHGLGSYERALREQQLGGVLMLAIGGPVYLAGGLWLVHLLLETCDQGRS